MACNSAGSPASKDRCQRGREPVVREDGSIEIPLTQGQIAIVSPESYPLVKDRRWCAQWRRDTRSFRAVSNGQQSVGHRPSLSMHRVVLEASDGVQVDHVNHDTLDNRLENIRLTTAAENQHNTRRRADNSSGFKGVCWNRRDEHWQACIFLDGKRQYLGYFATAEAAARAYDAAARELHGEHAFTNEMAGLLPREFQMNTAARAEKLPSVSAIITRFKESGALIGWAYKMGKEGKDLRGARELTVGVLVEQMIEDYLLGTSRPLPAATAEDLEKARRCFDGFKTWAIEHRVELVAHQVELTSDEHRFVGRVDAILRIDGDLATADWKVTNGIYLDHLLQLAAYRILLRERDGDAAPNRSALIQIGKDDGLVHPHEWPSDTLDLAERMFLVLRSAWDLDKALKPAINPAA